MFYNARWYDSALGRFIQADTDVPESQEYENPLHEEYQYGGFGAYRGLYAYGSNSPIWHSSIDVAGSGVFGSSVHPVLSGVVVEKGWENTGYGNYIIIKHSSPFGDVYSIYAHLGTTKEEDGTYVEEGDVVYKNSTIGTVGNSTTGTRDKACVTDCMDPHLHLEIRYETNVNLSEGNSLLNNKDYWAFDSSWVYDFFDLGQIYGYVDNNANSNPDLPR